MEQELGAYEPGQVRAQPRSRCSFVDRADVSADEDVNVIAGACRHACRSGGRLGLTLSLCGARLEIVHDLRGRSDDELAKRPVDGDESASGHLEDR